MRRPVRVTGRPYIALDVGGAKRRATYVGPIVTRASRLSFRYTVRTGDFDSDGVALCTSGFDCGSIWLNGGSIRAPSNSPGVDLELPTLGAQSGHKVDAAVSLAGPGCEAEYGVDANWALKPSGIDRGEKFRLLFVTSTKRDATSTDIGDYNRFVQGRAAAGHAAIQEYGAGFRALGSTQTVNARANTCTRSADTGAKVYWLNGAKVGDNYADLYDGAWDSNADRFENGSQNGEGNSVVWTGTNSDGTTDPQGFLGRDHPGFISTDVKQGNSAIRGRELAIPGAAVIRVGPIRSASTASRRCSRSRARPPRT